MIVTPQIERLRTIEQLRAFVEGAEPVDYKSKDHTAAHEVDKACDGVSRLAMCAILRCQFDIHGDPRFVRLAGLSRSHLYNYARRAPTDEADDVGEDAS